MHSISAYKQNILFISAQQHSACPGAICTKRILFMTFSYLIWSVRLCGWISQILDPVDLQWVTQCGWPQWRNIRIYGHAMNKRGMSWALSAVCIATAGMKYVNFDYFLRLNLCNIYLFDASSIFCFCLLVKYTEWW